MERITTTSPFHPLVWNSVTKMKRIFSNYDLMQAAITAEGKKVIKDMYERGEITPELYQKCLNRWKKNGK